MNDDPSAFASPVRTERLLLVPASAAHLAAELESNAAFEARVGASVPESWPPGEYDRSAQEYFYSALTAGGDAATGWYGWYAVLQSRDGTPARAAVVGCGGYFGPPSDEGVIEIGYSICKEFQGHGYATELARGLVQHVREHVSPTRIVAHTYENNPASIAVLERSGFIRAAESDQPDALLFEWAGPR